MQTRLAFVLFLLAAPVCGQDMVAVDWSGQVYALDSHAATTSLLGQGLVGQNATAIDANGTIWSTSRAGSSPNWVYSLTSVDPRTGAASVVHAGIPDVRGLAYAGGSMLWAIVNGNPDAFYSIDTATGVCTRIGSTGSLGNQGLAVLDGVLYGWNISFGLTRIDTVTGHVTNVNPAIGGPGGGGIQFLAARSDGTLIGGKNDLYWIDPASGRYTLIGSFGPGVDLRGADEWFGSAQSFGTGCAGAFGTVSLQVTGVLGANGQATVTSGNHASGAPGALLLGFSRTNHQGLPLPVLLDPLLGTSDCSLLVSIDAMVFGLATNTAPATLSFQLPLPPVAAGLTVHLQHFAFEAVAGGLSSSDGVTLFVGY